MNGFLNPEEILNQLELHKEMTAADFGSGSGGWAIPLAKKLEDGKVYAIDVLEEPLSALKSKAKIERISNIETIRSNIEGKEGSGLKENLLDLVLMTNLLFEVENKKAVFDEAKKVLKNNGKILVVDWKPESPVGPKRRISPDDVKKIAEEIGLKLEKPSTGAKLGAGPVPHRNKVSGAGEFQAGDYHYGLVFTKP
jgi:ubiquinone/menaquinone biosynthesis C-methylase UbiE